jgi:hypothetical protein
MVRPAGLSFPGAESNEYPTVMKGLAFSQAGTRKFLCGTEQSTEENSVKAGSVPAPGPQLPA